MPALLYFALVWTALALWANDVRGLYIAAICAMGGVVQLVRQEPR
ncbi:hypothetical protein [Nocardioides sp.]